MADNDVMPDFSDHPLAKYLNSQDDSQRILIARSWNNGGAKRTTR